MVLFTHVSWLIHYLPKGSGCIKDGDSAASATSGSVYPFTPLDPDEQRRCMLFGFTCLHEHIPAEHRSGRIRRFATVNPVVHVATEVLAGERRKIQRTIARRLPMKSGSWKKFN